MCTYMYRYHYNADVNSIIIKNAMSTYKRWNTHYQHLKIQFCVHYKLPLPLVPSAYNFLYERPNSKFVCLQIHSETARAFN